MQCKEMLYGLCSLQTNLHISLHHQSHVLQHHGTTCKELMFSSEIRNAPGKICKRYNWPQVSLTKRITHFMLTLCSMALHHQMPLVGGGVHLTKHQPDQQANRMSYSPVVVWLLTTRCMYWEWGVSSGQQGVSGGIGVYIWKIQTVYSKVLLKSQQYIEDNRTWVQVNQTSVCTTHGYQMHLPGGVHVTKHHSPNRLMMCHADLQ